MGESYVLSGRLTASAAQVASAAPVPPVPTDSPADAVACRGSASRAGGGTFRGLFMGDYGKSPDF